MFKQQENTGMCILKVSPQPGMSYLYNNLMFIVLLSTKSWQIAPG